MYEKIFKLICAIGNHSDLYVSWNESVLPNNEKKLFFNILEKKTRFHECVYSICIKSLDDLIIFENIYINLKSIYLKYFGEEYKEYENRN